MLYDILVDFPGSQDGSVTERFFAGTQRDLSDYLAAIVVPCGWARPIQMPAELPAEAVAEASVDEPMAHEQPRRRGRKSFGGQ